MTNSIIKNEKLFLATLLGGVNKQKFKVNYKNRFLFFLTVLFFCDVDENGVDITVSNGPLHKFHKNVLLLV